MMLPNVEFEDAFNYLVEQLAKTPGAGPGQSLARQRRANGSDIWIALVCEAYWYARKTPIDGLSQDEKEPYVAAFYDAAWQLCRRGILRPAAAIPDGQSEINQLGARINSAPFFGDGYSLTGWGREWVNAVASERSLLPSDPSRITAVFYQFKILFGAGYAQATTS